MDNAPPEGLTGTGLLIPESHAYRGSVWHYTDSSGLAGIASGGEDGTGRLWATAATMLNDPDELAYGVKQIIDWYESPQDAGGSVGAHLAIQAAMSGLKERILARPAYVVCASTQRDALGQWRGYPGSGGYAVELDTGHEYTLADRPDPDTTFSFAPTWVKVAYTKDEQEELIRSVFSYVLDSGTHVGRVLATDDAKSATIIVGGLLSGLAAALKHESFSEEEEVRLVAFLPPGMSPSFRGSGRGVVPFLEVCTAAFPNLLHPVKTFPIPIQGVRVGPPRGEGMEQRVRGVRILLESTGRASVPVIRSEIPFIP